MEAQIASGELVDVLDPDMDKVPVGIIAHALGMQVRFNGHVSRFYSTGEHSVHVSRVAESLCPGAGRRGLLHDAHEVLIGDMIWPLKHSGEFDGFLELEDRLEALVMRKFGVPESEEHRQAVHLADMSMAQIERAQLFPHTPEADAAWGEREGDTSFVPEHCWPQCWPPEVAKTIFLDRFREVQQ